MTLELLTFLIYIICGAAIGIIFDIFRIIRRSFKISDLHTNIEDIIFCILIFLFLIYMFFIYNSGNIRLFMLFALAFGLIIYLFTISKYFIKINVKIILLIKKIINIILHFLFIPIKYITNNSSAAHIPAG